MQGVLFAAITAIVFGLWTVFHKQAASYINNLFGAIVVSLTAVVLGLILFLPKMKTITLYTDPRGIIFAVLAGFCALAIDFFALKAYGSGLQMSIGGPIIIAGSVAIASFVGFFLGESITLTKICGLVLILIGSAVLSVFG
jgi:uncharacterized membrane protein